MSEGSTAIFDVLSTLFGALFSNAPGAASIPTWVSSDLIDLAFTQAEFVDALDGAWEWLKKVLDDLWWVWIVPFIEKLQQILDDILTWLQNFLGPLLDVIAKIIFFVKHYIIPILGDVIEVIQRMRVILALFRILGLQWAAKLDADLALVQAYLTQVLQDVLATVNTITSLVGLVFDPAGIIRRDFFPGTLFASLGAVKRANGFGTDRASTPTENTQVTQYQHAALSGGPLVTNNPTGGYIVDPAVAATEQQIRDQASGEGPVIYAF